MAITFMVNLQNAYDVLANSPYTSGGTAHAATAASIRSTYFPDLYLAERELKNGDTFEVSGLNALYLRNNLTSGEFKILDEVSGTP